MRGALKIFIIFEYKKLSCAWSSRVVSRIKKTPVFRRGPTSVF
nr:MAG TPA: hypothetical protein [Caudoviricetes sp.]